MILVHTLKHIKEYSPARIVIVHTDFLADYSLLFLNGLLGKIGRLHKTEKYLKRFVNIVGTAEQIASLIERGIGVCGRSGFSVKAENIAVLIFKKLVLQIVSYTVGYGNKIRLVLSLELSIYRTVFGAEKSVRSAVVLHFPNVNVQTRRMLDIGILFAGAFVFNDFLFHIRQPPFL